MWSALGAAVAGPWVAKNVASRDRKFAEIMSSTAHQREVADLRAAGLNPILSATGGRGATAPVTKGTAKDPGAAFAKVSQLKLIARQLDIQDKAVTAKAALDTATARQVEATTHPRETKGAFYEWLNQYLLPALKSDALGPKALGTSAKSIPRPESFPWKVPADKRRQPVRPWAVPQLRKGTEQETPPRYRASRRRKGESMEDFKKRTRLKR